MAFDDAPSAWIASWSEDGTNITIPLASLGISAADADGTTGDIRKVVLAILATLYTEWASLAAADRPSKMTISQSTNAAGTATNRRYTVTFTQDTSSFTIAAE